MSAHFEQDEYEGSSAMPAIALGLMVAAWIVFLFTMNYGRRLHDRWGPAPDATDSLRRNAWVAGETSPYHTVVVLLDVVAASLLLFPSRRGWPFRCKIATVVLMIPSLALHGFVKLASAFFGA